MKCFGHNAVISLFVLFGLISCNDPTPLGGGAQDVSQGIVNGLNTNNLGGTNFRLYITDAETQNFDKVMVTVLGAKLKKDGQEDVTLFSNETTFDLLTLKDDITAILGDAQLDPGSYSQIILDVSKVVVTIGDQEYEVKLPSDKLKIKFNQEVKDGEKYGVVIDFDPNMAIVTLGGGSPQNQNQVKAGDKGEGGPKTQFILKPNGVRVSAIVTIGEDGTATPISAGEENTEE